MNIKNKFLISFCLTSLIPILLISSITIKSVLDDAYISFENRSSVDIQLVEKNFSNFFDLIGTNVSALSELDSIRDTDSGEISQYLGPTPKVPSDVIQNSNNREKSIFNMFSKIGKSNPVIAYVYMGDSNGGYLEWPGTAEYSNWDPRKEVWYGAAKNANFNVVKLDGYYWEPDDAVYVAVTKGYKNLEGQFDGFISIDVSLKKLTEMVKNLKLGETGKLIIIEQSGRVLVDAMNAENNFKTLSELSGEHFKEMTDIDSGVIEVNVDGVDYLANVYQSESLDWKIIGLMENDEIYSGAINIAWTTFSVGSLLIVAFMFLGYVLSQKIVAPINTISENLKEIANGQGDLTKRISVDSKDETGELAMWFNSFIESTRELIVSIKENSVQVDKNSNSTSALAKEVAESSASQLASIDQIVTAITEMSSAANEVSANSVNTADISQEGLNLTVEGRNCVHKSSESVNSLVDSINTSNTEISELGQEMENINSIISTIQDIAGQTNLLALNAAIEAARAGEQGRGFAVVADEVRNLAKRTQNSTEEINTILGRLVEKSKLAIKAMEQSSIESENSVKLSSEAINAFHQIEEVVEKIRDMTTQTATATEEQHLVTQDINKNVVEINDSSDHVSDLSGKVSALCKQQAELSSELSELVSKFKTE